MCKASCSILGLGSPFLSTIVLFNKQRFSLGKDPEKEWGRYPRSMRKVSSMSGFCPSTWPFRLSQQDFVDFTVWPVRRGESRG